MVRMYSFFVLLGGLLSQTALAAEFTFHCEPVPYVNSFSIDDGKIEIIENTTEQMFSGFVAKANFSVTLHRFGNNYSDSFIPNINAQGLLVTIDNLPNYNGEITTNWIFKASNIDSINNIEPAYFSYINLALDAPAATKASFIRIDGMILYRANCGIK